MTRRPRVLKHLDKVPAELDETMQVVEMLLTQDEPLSLLQVAFLRQTLYCYPELHEPVSNFLDQSGRLHELNQILDQAIVAALDKNDRMEAALTHLSFAMGNVSAAGEIVSEIAEVPGDVPAGDALYLAASVQILREKLGATHNARFKRDQQTSTALDPASLKHYFTKQTPASSYEQRKTPKPLTLDGIRTQRLGFTDISRLKSQYAKVDPDNFSLTALQHPAGQFFIFGPYSKLLSGRYRLEKGFICSKATRIELEICDSSVMKVIERKGMDIDAGSTTIVFTFDWDAETMQTYESRIRVIRPRFGKVSLVSYMLQPQRSVLQVRTN